jgi:hypothetical protein
MITSLWNRLLKSKSHPAARRRPDRLRLGVEELETRLVPTVSVSLTNGQLQIIGAGAGNTITLDHFGQNTLVITDSGTQPFADSAITSISVLDAGGGNDTINVHATVRPTVITALGGNDTVTVGNSGRVQGVQAPVSVTHFGNTSGVALTVDDSKDPNPSTNVTMGVSNGTGTITGLGQAATISYSTNGVSSVTVDGGLKASTFTITDTAANNRVGFLTTTLNTGGGDSVVNVEGTTGTLAVNGQGTSADVDIGLNDNPQEGGVQFIKGTVIATCPHGFLELAVEDAAGPPAPNVIMGVNTADFGFITGLAPATILYAEDDLDNLDVHGPQTNTNYTITDTASFAFTSIFGGNGNNTFNVLKTDFVGDIELIGGTGHNTFNIGSAANTLDTIQGGVFLHHTPGGTDTVNINDQGSTTPHTYTVVGATLERSGAAIIDFTGFDLTNVHINKGPQ